MYEQITKSEFWEQLKTKRNTLLFARGALNETPDTKIMRLLHDIDFTGKGDRYCREVHSSFLVFSDDSRLYRNEIATCYRHGNVILTRSERYDSFSEQYLYSIIAYGVSD